MYFLLARTVQATIVMLCVALVGFLVFQFIGDPVLALVGQETTVEDREALRESLGLNDPILVQYARYVVNAVHGDFGISYSFNRDVSEMIADRLPATIELVMLSGVLSLILAIPAGIYTGIRRKGGMAQTIMALSVIGVSIPSFLLGILLILVFSVWLNWLPSFGRGDVATVLGLRSSLFTWDGLGHALMPAAVLCLFQLGVILRLIRAEMLEVLRTDYIRFAWARGLPGQRVYFRHALKNTLGARRHSDWPPAQLSVRLFDHHRTGLSMAGHGVAVAACHRSKRYPAAGGLPDLCRAGLHDFQPRGGCDLCADRPAHPARSALTCLNAFALISGTNC